MAIEPLVGLARIHLAQGDLSQAHDQVREILSHLETRSLDGTQEPFQVYLTCYRVLRANHESAATDVLNDAYGLLQERAAKISDKEIRHSFLESVAAHSEIIREFVATFNRIPA